MKNFQKIALGLVAGALALSFSAFTAPKKATTDWYAPISSTLLASDPAAQNFSSYNSTPLDVVPDCHGDTYICAAEFPNTATGPSAVIEKDE